MNFTQKKKLVTDILNSVAKEYPIEKDLVKFIEQYMIEHHNYIETLDIQKLWVQKNSTFNHNNFYFNGTINGRLVVKQLLGTSNVSKNKDTNVEDKRLVQGMREAISKDLYEYKRFVTELQGQKSCSMCNKLFTDLEDVHVDHCGEKEFRHIKADFLSVNPNLIVEERADNCDSLTRLIDNEDKELWINYHHLTCNLQLICRTCNLTKEKK